MGEYLGGEGMGDEVDLKKKTHYRCVRNSQIIEQDMKKRNKLKF